MSSNQTKLTKPQCHGARMQLRVIVYKGQFRCFMCWDNEMPIYMYMYGDSTTHKVGLDTDHRLLCLTVVTIQRKAEELT